MFKRRAIEKKLLEYAKYFKVVQVSGARQVGKSTLLEELLSDIPRIVFDPVKDEYGVRRDPDMFLDNFPAPVILDEVQYVPELLPALKRRVDLSDEKGQYFITGSQNFSVMKSISESLAGRVGILNLEAMSSMELSEAAGSSWAAQLLDTGDINSAACVGLINDGNDSLKDIMFRGGMPGIIDTPDFMLKPYFDSYLHTYVERDVRMMEGVTNLSRFTSFFALCAALSAQEINDSKLGRDVEITRGTASRWFETLIQSYQCFTLRPYFGNAVKRLSKKKKGYFMDTGLMCHMQYISSPEALAVSPLYGACFETFVVGILRKELGVSFYNAGLYHWRTSNGAEVDIVMERDGKLTPIEVKCKTALNAYDARGIKSFNETYGAKVNHGYIIYAGRECYKVNDQITAVPWNAIF